MKIKIQQFKKGFSIGEVMLSTVVLGVALVAIISLISVGMRYSMDGRNQIIASELAQEGVELVRNIRDNNIASGSTSFTYFTDANSCQIDKNYVYLTSGNINCAGANTFQLKYNNNFYEHTSGTATNFYRRIIVAAYGSVGKKITSVVTWNNITPPSAPTSVNCNAGLKCTYVEEILTDR